MGKLEAYSSIKEKDNFFNQLTINTKNDFDEFYKLLSSASANTSVWRGVCEAKYKIYSSLQRFWISNYLDRTNLTVTDFLKQNLNYASEWNSKVIEKAFEKFYNIESATIYSILSLLRHHGAPSPLIDFSRNAKVALYFACQPLAATASIQDIDNYFSVYEIKKDHVILQQNIKEIYLRFWPAQRSFQVQLQDLLQGLTDPADINKVTHHFTANFCQGLLTNKDLFFKQFEKDYPLHSPYQIIEDKKGDTLHYFVNTNFAGVNQEGLFVMNIDPVYPLETIVYERAKELGQQKGISSKEFYAAFDRQKQYFLSYNIHKSLRRYALKKLADESIDQSYIYPDLFELGKNCEYNFMEKL